MSTLLACPHCQSPWPTDAAELAALTACPGCLRALSVTTFPALFRENAPGGAQPEKVVVDGEASCFYHADKRAVVPCNSCGRFLCALCDIALGDRHLCPGCLESGRAKGKLTELETSRTLYDSMALALATLPLLCVWPSLLCAPAALVVAIYGWRKPTSIVRRSKWRLWLAVVLSLVQILGWTAFFVLSFTRFGEELGWL